MPTPEARLATILDHTAAADPCGVLLYFHTPAEAEAFLADYTRSACQGAPPQTGGGDAGERARALVHDICPNDFGQGVCDYPACRDSMCEFWKSGDKITAALRSSHREGAEAMRADCALTLRQRKDQWDDDHNRGHCCSLTVQNELGASEAAIRALPIPGKTDA